MVVKKEHNALEQKRKRQLNLILIITGILACAGLVYLYYDVDFRKIPYIEESERKELDLEIDTKVPPVPDELQDQKPVTTPEYVVPERGAKKLNYTFGIALGERLSVVSEREVEKILDDIKSLGVGWIRVDMAWNSIQPTSKDVYVWEPFDRIVREARERGIAVLPIITYTPVWARDASCGTSKCPPANSEDFAEFARTAALRYTPQGVHVWEIWNEPNIRKFWASGADYARYADLLKHTYIAIHEVDGEAIVLSGGLAPTDTRGGNITAREFLEGMYEHGAGGYFDALAFHPYSFPLGPTDLDKTNAWSQMAETEWNLRASMREHGDAHKKIWLTEYGAPTGGPGSIASNSTHVPWSIPDHVTEEYQAKLLELAIQAQRDYAWTGPLFWYSYQDLGTSESTIENFFGIVRFDGSHKSAYYRLRDLLIVQ